MTGECLYYALRIWMDVYILVWNGVTGFGKGTFCKRK